MKIRLLYIAILVILIQFVVSPPTTKPTETKKIKGLGDDCKSDKDCSSKNLVCGTNFFVSKKFGALSPSRGILHQIFLCQKLIFGALNIGMEGYPIYFATPCIKMVKIIKRLTVILGNFFRNRSRSRMIQIPISFGP